MKPKPKPSKQKPQNYISISHAIKKKNKRTLFNKKKALEKKKHRGLLFRPYRALGFVTDSLPFSVVFHGTHSYVVTSVGKTWQSYNTEHLDLAFVGPPQEHKIRAFVADRNKTIFVAVRTSIFIQRRNITILELVGHKKRVKHLLLLGGFLLSIDEGGELLVWETKSGHIVRSLQFPDTQRISCFVHPPTYLNKILVGTEEGHLQLWNFKTKKLVYSFQKYTSGIQCLEPSPAVDIVAIGLNDGKIHIHNIKTDEVVASFSLTCPVTCLSFRLDGEGMLGAGTVKGHIVLFDLFEKRVAFTLFNAHSGRVTSLKFFPSQPILLSSGIDNSLKMWLFKGTNDEHGATLLRSRSGHSGPVNKVMFYGNTGEMLLTTGALVSDPSLRCLYLFLDRRNKMLTTSRAYCKAQKIQFLDSLEGDLPPVLNLDNCTVREKEWDSVLTCHEQWSFAYSWNMQKGGIGKRRFHTRDTEFPNSFITAVAISSCGNFAYIGSDSGWIDKYNLQSGIHRGSAALRAKSTTLRFNSLLCRVQSLALDLYNKYLVSAFLDGSLIWWDASSLKLKKQIKLSMPLSFLKVHKEASLVALACDDFVIRLYDVDTFRLARRLIGHTAKITDAVFNVEGRWIVSSSMDCTIRVWDVPSARLYYSFQVPTPAKSLAISPSNEYLVTTHINNKGIYLWTNDAHFTSLYKSSEFQSLQQTQVVAFPSTQQDNSQEEEQDEPEEDLERTEENKEIHLEEEEEEENESENKKESEEEGEEDEEDELAEEREGEEMREERIGDEEALARIKKMAEEKEEALAATEKNNCKGLVSLSSLPRPTWTSIPLFQEIRERNKPKQEEKKTKKAPFFLPTTQSATPRFVLAETEDKTVPTSRIGTFSQLISSPFVLMLREAYSSSPRDYTQVFEALSKMSATAMDFEIRTFSLGRLSEQDLPDDLTLFMEMLVEVVPTKSNYELVQAVLTLIVQIHGDVITKSPTLLPLLDRLRDQCRESWCHLVSLFHHSLCLLNHFTGLQS